jgi:pSer/pThr/pTyr-binding forkhead associated (FHA) protein
MAELVLAWREGANSREARITGDRAVEIGRLPENDIQIDHKTVSRRHARIRCGPAGFVIADLTAARNPPRINDQPITAETALRAGDRIALGDVPLWIAALHADAAMADTVPAQAELTADPVPSADTNPAVQPSAQPMPALELRWTVQGKTDQRTFAAPAEITIGRLPENLVPINVNTVSRKHAAIVARDNRFVLTDLTDGKNAITVNQRTVVKERVLNKGDVIRLGTVTIVVTDIRRPDPSGASDAPGTVRVVCPNCLRELEGPLDDCPWCGAVLDNAPTIMVFS